MNCSPLSIEVCKHSERFTRLFDDLAVLEAREHETRKKEIISIIYTTWMPRRMSISTGIAQHRRAEGQMDGFSSLERFHFHLAWHQSL